MSDKKTFFFSFHTPLSYTSHWMMIHFPENPGQQRKQLFKDFGNSKCFFLQSKRTRKIVILFTRIGVNKFTVKKNTVHTIFPSLFCSVSTTEHGVKKKNKNRHHLDHDDHVESINMKGKYMVFPPQKNYTILFVDEKKLK